MSLQFQYKNRQKINWRIRKTWLKIKPAYLKFSFVNVKKFVGILIDFLFNFNHCSLTCGKFSCQTFCTAPTPFDLWPHKLVALCWIFQFLKKKRILKEKSLVQQSFFVFFNYQQSLQKYTYLLPFKVWIEYVFSAI